MNGPSTDGSENVIDIFVLCKSETEAPLTTRHLEQKGYRVTLFSDSPHLLETLRFGKPNLLICDSQSLGKEAYEVCRQIKSDNDLWMMPVLILTSASSLSDLLFVLDSNADNFIACPTDPSYLLSLIEGMLVTPVERQTPEQIKTQFKIQHDDHMFVVTADRRKLLEFLLSSFEIAVKKSEDLASAGSENASLLRTVQKLQEAGAEQARVIAIINTTLQQKEQKITALNGELKDAGQQITGLAREKDFLVQERETNKARIAAAEEQNRSLLAEKEEAARTHGSEIADLQGQVSALEEELAATRSDLLTTKKILDEEVTRRTDAETSLEELLPEKEQAEKTVRALTLECEQVKTACTSEKNRAQAAEQEIRSVLQAKTQSEQDLTRIIDDLKGTAKQQAAEISRFKDGQAADKGRITSLEEELKALAAEKENVQRSLTTAADKREQELCELRSSFAARTAELEEKSRQYAALELTCHEHKTAGQQLQDHASSIKSELATVRSDLEARLAALVAEKAAVECTLKKTTEDLKRELGDLQASFAATTAKLEEKNRQYAALDVAYGEQKVAGQHLLETVDAIKNEIDTVRSDLEQEKQKHAAAVSSLQATLQERDIALASIRGAHDDVKTDLHAHRDDLVQVKSELVAVSEDRATLKGRLEESSALVHRLEARLQAASAEQAESDKQIRSLADELEQVKTSLETERRQRRTSEESLSSAASAGEKFEEMRRQAIQEQERLRGMLEAEQKESRDAKERARAEHETHEKRIQELLVEVATATNRLHILEEQVKETAREKREAEEKALRLAAEIDQARTALADEWEDHMTAQERLTVAVEEKKLLEKTMQKTGDVVPATAAIPAVISRTSSLPAFVPFTSRAVTTPQAPPAMPGIHRGTVIEDLFEDDVPASPEDDRPVVSIVHDPDPEVTIPLPPISPDPALPFDDAEDAGDSCSAMGEGSESGAEEMSEEEDGDEDEDEKDSPAVPGLSSRTGAPVVGFSFNRNQWFDLLKWAHHSGSLSQDQRLQIIRMGRLIQRGRRLTSRQDEQVREIIGLAQSLGYRFT
jgi:DNA-binding response OmpR family regulator